MNKTVSCCECGKELKYDLGTNFIDEETQKLYCGTHGNPETMLQLNMREGRDLGMSLATRMRVPSSMPNRLKGKGKSKRK